MKKIVIPTIILFALLLILLMLHVRGNDETAFACRDFLAGYGWQTEPEPEGEYDVFIPEEFDVIYTNYNILQKEAGLDLLPYRGMRGIRYSFVITNYPFETGEPVYADVLTVDGKPVAGDIMTVSIDGFMHSLMMPRL